VTEKPLHLKVAEALGWSDFTFDTWWIDDDGKPEGKPFWHGHDPVRTEVAPTTALQQGFKYVIGTTPNPNYHPERLHWPVPHYDTDWAATGPLIEKYGVKLERVGPHQWSAWVNETAHGGNHAYGDTPLTAVCGLIIHAKAAGKLEAA